MVAVDVEAMSHEIYRSTTTVLIAHKQSSSSTNLRNTSLAPDTQRVPLLRDISMEIKQIFFDCDNTLVQTEYSAALICAEVVNKVMEDNGIARRYTVEELVSIFMGRTARQMIVDLEHEHGYTLSKEQRAYYALFEEDRVVAHILRNSEPCFGIQAVLKALSSIPTFQLAVVSSSPIRRIKAALQACQLDQYFKPEHVYSAKNSMPKSISKPDPAIYKWAMEKNYVEANQCIAFEDSRSGARAAIDAGIATIAYVGAYPIESQRHDAARILLDEGCKVAMEEWGQFDDCFGQVVKGLGGHYERRYQTIQTTLTSFATGKLFELKPPAKVMEVVQIELEQHTDQEPIDHPESSLNHNKSRLPDKFATEEELTPLHAVKYVRNNSIDGGRKRPSESHLI